MVYQYFNIPIPTHKPTEEVSIMASEPSDQHEETRCERIAGNKLLYQAAYHVFDEMPKSANTIEIDDIESMEQEESNQGEPIVVEELPHQAAYQALDEMPELFDDEINLKIAHESSIEELHDLEAFDDDVREQAVWALVNIVGDSPQCCDLARQSGELMPHLTQINEHAESLWMDKNEVTNLINLPSDILAQEEIVANYIDELCFDPGGASLPLVDNSLRPELGGRALFVVEDSFKLAIVPLESTNLWCDEELTKMTFSLSPEGESYLDWIANRKVEKVEFVLKVGNYGDCLPLFYPTNGQTLKVISICAGMLNFDPKGRELRNLVEPFLQRSHFLESSLLKFLVPKEISCLVLYSLDGTQLLVDANNESLIFYHGGDGLTYSAHAMCLSNGCVFVLVIHHIPFEMPISEQGSSIHMKGQGLLH